VGLGTVVAGRAQYLSANYCWASSGLALGATSKLRAAAVGRAGVGVLDGPVRPPLPLFIIDLAYAYSFCHQDTLTVTRPQDHHPDSTSRHNGAKHCLTRH
jgi:hypothetical protein